MKRLLNQIRKIGYRVTAFVAALLMFVTGLDSNAYAGALKGTSMTGKNAYIFEVVTGIHDGENIQFLEIVYIGTDNNEYRQLFFPNQDSQYLGRIQVAKVGSDVPIANDIEKMYGYKGKTGLFDTSVSSLSSYSMAQYYFTTDVPIKSIKYFDGFTGKGNDEWTCQGMRLFKVDTLYGIKMAGEWSNTWYIDFDGELIGELNIDVIKKYNWSTLDAGYLDMMVDAKVRQGDELKGKDYVKHVSQQTNHNYGFRFDFADVFGAGFESLINDYACNKAPLNGLPMIENLTLNITYVDVYGQPRFLYLPAATSAVHWAYRNLNETDSRKPVLGVGQQGGGLAFTGIIPDCGKIDSVTLAVGSEKAEAIADIVYDVNSISYNKWTDSRGYSYKRAITKAGEQNLHTRRSELSKQDDAYYLCVAIYDMSKSAIIPKVENAMLKYDYVGDPIYCQTATGVGGKRLVSNAVNDLGLKEGKKLTLPTEKKNYYVCQFTTESALNSGEVSGLKIKLSYMNTKGEKQETDEINIKNAVLDYYGYWPGSTGGSDFAYAWTTGSGKTTSFLVALKDVNYFTGAVISSPPGSNADYQFKDFSMYSLTEKYPTRSVAWTDKLTENGKSTYVNIYRNLDTEAIKIASIPDTTLIQNGDEVNVDFTSSKVTAVKDEGFDFTKYAITYADAMKDYGFVKKRKSYEVQISIYDDVVATDDDGNIVSTGGNGDSGSENKFFFQLEFEYGTSAYVLGNQGLTEGDKFVSGRTHTFHVHMNEDYGNVTGINIISDEIDENAKPEDKMRINDIKVTEVAASGTHICWVASNVGWVGADYSDSRNKYGGKGKSGRSAAELARSVNIDYTTNVIQLEFALSTGSYQVEEYTEKDAEQYGVKAGQAPRPQFYGTINAKLAYTKSDGTLEFREFDLVEELYNYRKKVVAKDNGLATSDKNSMFRANHTDRFILNIDDIGSLNHLDLSVSAKDYPVTWAVTGLSARIVKDAGKLKINQFEEYQYDRNEEEEPVAYMDKDAYHFIIGGTSQPCNIYFDENEIKIDPQLRTATSVISRTPTSANDKMNIFIFPTMGGSNDGIGIYDIGVKAQYNHLYNGPRQAACSKLEKYVDEDGTEMFYVMGLEAQCMSDLNQLVVEASSLKGTNANMDYAIVQQIRSGVVVNTYYVDLDDENAYYSIYKAPSNDMGKIGYYEKQRLYLQIAPGTQQRNLLAEKQDIAFAITYKLPFDATGAEYVSPYVYATDELIKKLYEGQVIGVDYDQMYVGEITGIRIATTGTVEANIGCACLANYHVTADGEMQLEKYYNFAKGITVGNNVQKMTVTSTGTDNEEAVRHLAIQFSTAHPSSAYESGTNSPVKFTLYTTNEDGQVNDPPLEIADLRKYITDGSGNFLTGTTQTVEMLVTGGAAGLRRIVLEPQSEAMDGSAGWSLDKVVAQLDSETPISRVIEERIYEGRPKTILLSDLSLSADIYNYNYSKEDDVFDQVNMRQGEELKLMMRSEQPLHILPTSNGSEYGCRVYATEITADGFESGALDGVISHNESSKRYSFTAPVNYDEEKKYRIYIESVEIPTVKMYLDVTVAVTPRPVVSDDDAAGEEDTAAGDSTVSGDSAVSDNSVSDDGTSDNSASESNSSDDSKTDNKTDNDGSDDDKSSRNEEKSNGTSDAGSTESSSGSGAADSSSDSGSSGTTDGGSGDGSGNSAE
ncbi:MAG: hypothetical protein IKQ56_06740 [Lachnospiraceae bacterium]|nr:hypothetical protein [Lachnospiraceae bacterium]